MTQPLHDKLLACDFCGSGAVRMTRNSLNCFAQCSSCGAQGPTVTTLVIGEAKASESAATAWNTRAELTRTTAIVDQLYNALKNFLAGADRGCVSLEVDKAAREALANLRTSETGGK